MAESAKIEFDRKGYTVLKRSFDPAKADGLSQEIARIHTSYLELKAQFSDLYRLGEWSVRSPHIASSQIKNFLFSEDNRNACEKFTGTDADLYWCTTAAKPPERGKAFPWHQDAGYGEGPKDYVIFWAALDDVDEENGCLWAIPGSHVDGVYPYLRIPSTDG
jgi:phytanoyl-CoA hydroxylase